MPENKQIKTGKERRSGDDDRKRGIGRGGRIWARGGPWPDSRWLDGGMKAVAETAGSAAGMENSFPMAS